MEAILYNVRDEALKRVIDALSVLVTEADDIAFEKDSFRSFSSNVAQLRSLLCSLHAKRVDTKPEWPITVAVLQRLETEIKKSSEIIRKYNSGSRLRLLLKCRELLLQLQQSTNEIASAVQQMALANLDSALELKTKCEDIAHGLQTIEFKMAASTEAVVLEIERSTIQNGRDQEHTRRLLQQIADAVGASPSIALVRNEITLLRQEREELEVKKLHAEAFQLSQLINLLYSSDMIASPRVGSPSSSSSQHLIGSFTCPLTSELMEDPVAVVCGHSFEKEAVLGRFAAGERTCPTCGSELHSQELTPNIALRSSIQEWKHRNAEIKLQSALTGLASTETSVPNQAVKNLLTAMEMPGFVDKVSEQHLVPKLVELLKGNDVDPKAVLTCLSDLARYSDDNKDAIADRRAIRYIVKQIYRGQAASEALEVLSELSKKAEIAEKIGNTRDSIPSLVCLLQSSDPEMHIKSLNVLQHLSSNTKFVIKMAEAGHFTPFFDHFSQGNSETKADMAAELARMPLREHTAKNFENIIFINKLINSLYSSSSRCKSECLHCIKKLSSFNSLAMKFLSDRDTIPALLGLMCSTLSEPTKKKEALEILVSLVEISEPNDYKTNTSLEELHSEHIIDEFLQLISTSTPVMKSSILHLLSLTYKRSDDARQSIQSNPSVTYRLFSIIQERATPVHKAPRFARVGGGSIIRSLFLVFFNKEVVSMFRTRDLPVTKESPYRCSKGRPHFSIIQDEREIKVRSHALKMISCIAEDCPDGVPVPASPTKETAIATLLDIFNSSPSREDRSAAAIVISKLPSDDEVIDKMLLKSGTLKAIHEVVCAAHDKDQGMTKEAFKRPPPSTTAASDTLLENTLRALLRYTLPAKPELQKQVIKLNLCPSLIRVLSDGSPPAKKQAALALSQLSQSCYLSTMTATSADDEDNRFFQFLQFQSLQRVRLWCGSLSPGFNQNICSVHDSACSHQDTFCLVKAGALRPLIDMLYGPEPGTSEAAMVALESLLGDDRWIPRAAAAIVDSEGVAAILEVLTKDSLSAKEKGLELFHKILKHSDDAKQESLCSKIIITNLLNIDTLRKKAAAVLAQMDAIPHQSSYF